MSNSPLQNTVGKVSTFARVLDGVLVVIFGALAIRSGLSADWSWAAGYGVCALFCLYTAVTGPIDRIFGWAKRNIVAGHAAPLEQRRHDVQMPVPVRVIDQFGGCLVDTQ